jgi:ligand-binding sensor domain-containing protein
VIPLLLDVDAPLSDVRHLETDGDLVAAATSGGVALYDAGGAHLATLWDAPSREAHTVAFDRGDLLVGTEQGALRWHDGWREVGLPGPTVGFVGSVPISRTYGLFGERVVGATDWGGAPVGWTSDGRVLLPEGEVALPGPVADARVVGRELRLALFVAAAVIDEHGLRILPIPATAAGPVWGTAEGALVDDAGRRVAAVPGGVTSILDVEGAYFVGTPDGLYRVDHDVRRLDPPGPCGAFVTGVTVWGGRPVIGTFDRGACVRGPGGWSPIAGLPTPLVNDVLAHGADLWVATGDGLLRVDDVGAERFVEVIDDAPAGAPGLNHDGVNAIARGPRGLWLADVLGPVEVQESGVWGRHRWATPAHSHTSVAACDDGTVWVGSEDDGLVGTGPGATIGRRVGRSRWRHVGAHDGLPEDWVMAVGCAPQGAWVGTYHLGFGRIDATGWYPVAGLEAAWVQAVTVDGPRVWVGTADGLYLVEHDVAVRLSGRDTHHITIDGDVVWVGTRSGLETWSRPTSPVALVR